MRTDRRTDVTKLIVAFRNFANAPKNSHIITSENTEHETGILQKENNT
jgi:hypothetical protein